MKNTKDIEEITRPTKINTEDHDAFYDVYFRMGNKYVWIHWAFWRRIGTSEGVSLRRYYSARDHEGFYLADSGRDHYGLTSGNNTYCFGGDDHCVSVYENGEPWALPKPSGRFGSFGFTDAFPVYHNNDLQVCCECLRVFPSELKNSGSACQPTDLRYVPRCDCCEFTPHKTVRIKAGWQEILTPKPPPHLELLEKWRKQQAKKESEKKTRRRSVYFVECSGQTKIGVATNVASRVSGMQTGCPLPLSVVDSVEMEFDLAHEIEQELHQMFWDKRTRGEWFNLTEGDVTTARERCRVAALVSASTD